MDGSAYFEDSLPPLRIEYLVCAIQDGAGHSVKAIYGNRFKAYKIVTLVWEREKEERVPDLLGFADQANQMSDHRVAEVVVFTGHALLDDEPHRD